MKVARLVDLEGSLTMPGVGSTRIVQGSPVALTAFVRGCMSAKVAVGSVATLTNQVGTVVSEAKVLQVWSETGIREQSSWSAIDDELIGSVKYGSLFSRGIGPDSSSMAETRWVLELLKLLTSRVSITVARCVVVCFVMNVDKIVARSTLAWNSCAGVLPSWVVEELIILSIVGVHSI